MNLELNNELESQLKDELTRHFEGLSYWNAADAASASLSLGGAESRFEYLKQVLPAEIFTPASKVLVSGMSAGSEMLAARKYGCGDIYGTEVDPFFMQLCQRRFGGMEGMHPFLYNGNSLAWDDRTFDLVVSGHIIEHTLNPFLYLKEHLRVLRDGGFFFLEFPTRFHRKELHTSLPSLEWLPSFMRNRALQILSSKLSPLDKEIKQKYRTILATGLKQVSLLQIRFWVARAACGSRIMHKQKPLPGFVRCVISKRS